MLCLHLLKHSSSKQKAFLGLSGFVLYFEGFSKIFRDFADTFQNVQRRRGKIWAHQRCDSLCSLCNANAPTKGDENSFFALWGRTLIPATNWAHISRHFVEFHFKTGFVAIWYRKVGFYARLRPTLSQIFGHRYSWYSYRCYQIIDTLSDWSYDMIFIPEFC